MVKQATIRVVLSIVPHYYWPTQQLDVENAFLHGDLYEEAYMAQPPGCVDPIFSNHICLPHAQVYL